jgi:hypothetical protein
MRIQAFSKDSFPVLLSLAGAMRMREGWDGAFGVAWPVRSLARWTHSGPDVFYLAWRIAELQANMCLGDKTATGTGIPRPKRCIAQKQAGKGLTRMGTTR